MTWLFVLVRARHLAGLTLLSGSLGSELGLIVVALAGLLGLLRPYNLRALMGGRIFGSLAAWLQMKALSPHQSGKEFVAPIADIRP